MTPGEVFQRFERDPAAFTRIPTATDRLQLFLRGDYMPLQVSGARANHVCAFARSRNGEEVVITVPRLLARLIGSETPLGPAVWGNDALVPPAAPQSRTYRNVFTGEIVETVERDGRRVLPLAAVFARFPVAMLARENGV